MISFNVFWAVPLRFMEEHDFRTRSVTTVASDEGCGWSTRVRHIRRRRRRRRRPLGTGSDHFTSTQQISLRSFGRSWAATISIHYLKVIVALCDFLRLISIIPFRTSPCLSAVLVALLPENRGESEVKHVNGYVLSVMCGVCCCVNSIWKFNSSGTPGRGRTQTGSAMCCNNYVSIVYGSQINFA